MYYSEIFRALFSVFLCGGTRIEDINAHLKDDLLSRPNTMVPSSDTILKGISELATDNIEYSSSKNNRYSFNPAAKLNDLMVKLLLETGQLKKTRHMMWISTISLLQLRSMMPNVPTNISKVMVLK